LKLNAVDLTLGVLAVTAAAGYLYETAQIPESLLEDAVGARGVPLAIGGAMAALGALLCFRGLLGARNGEPSGGERPAAASESLPNALRPHLQALALLGILATYVALLPHAGYIASTALLIAGMVALDAALDFCALCFVFARLDARGWLPAQVPHGAGQPCADEAWRS